MPFAFSSSIVRSSREAGSTKDEGKLSGARAALHGKALSDIPAVGSPFCAGGRCAESAPSAPLAGTSRFRRLRLIRDAFAVHTAPRRPPSGSTLSLSFLPDMPSSTTPERSQPVCSVVRFRHRPSPCYERLGSPDYPAIRFTQGRLFGASWFAFATVCQVARPLCRSDQSISGHRDFYLQASDESVTLLAAGYNYDSHWTVLSMGLSPIGVTTSVAVR